MQDDDDEDDNKNKEIVLITGADDYSNNDYSTA